LFSKKYEVTNFPNDSALWLLPGTKHGKRQAWVASHFEQRNLRIQIATLLPATLLKLLRNEPCFHKRPTGLPLQSGHGKHLGISFPPPPHSAGANSWLNTKLNASGFCCVD
jgi:hypothetical protein